MPYTRTEGFLSPGSVHAQQFMPNMTERKKNLWNSALTLKVTAEGFKHTKTHYFLYRQI